MNWLKRLFRLLSRLWRRSGDAPPDEELTVVEKENSVFLPQLIALLQEVRTVSLPLRGRSMRPFLEDGRDKALLEAIGDRPPLTGEAVLAEIRPGHFVLHRIVDISGQRVTLRGDGNVGTETCRIGDVKARAVGFYRKGRSTPDSTDGRKWRIYSWWWTRLLPIRRYLLFAMHPHVPQRLFGKHA